MIGWPGLPVGAQRALRFSRLLAWDRSMSLVFSFGEEQGLGSGWTQPDRLVNGYDSRSVGVCGVQEGSRHLAGVLFDRQGNQDRQDLREGHLVAVPVK